MSDENKVVEADDKVEVVAAVKPVPTKLEELDRLRVQEAWLETAVAQQALAGLDEQQQRLTVEYQLNTEQKHTHQRLLAEGQTKLEALMKELKEQYSIPDRYQIESKTGAINPPPPDQPAKR